MSDLLADTNVALGVSGSIAAVKVVELAHELRRHGAAVRAVMTDAATGIVHPWAVEFATERDVVTEITGGVEHVELCGRDGWADVLLLAPATANTVGKIAAAVDDTPVTTCATTALGAGVPVVCAPAMHEPMYDHPGVLEAIDRVESWGVAFVDPRIEEGKAKIATETAIVTETARAAGDRPLAGRRVVVTSGATSEAVDDVRVLTNRASGRTGRAVARALHVCGADVTLLHDASRAGGGPESSELPYADVVDVESAAEMTDAAVEACADADALISAAAISDYTVEAAEGKIRSGAESLTLDLTPTRKLLDTVRGEYPDLPLVGFKAESGGDDEALAGKARETLARADLAFVVANDAAVMGEAETRALIVRADEAREVAGEKLDLGLRIADELASELAGRA
ncbi:bifunctional phosphopantothenoylcysteine decarboxylase/phosphopantothenate--cysteine ligase CoaBC [Halobaculum gomorrense]|uniref:Coenzyme A biosynthesis bifunctional protein CoaBC n=1 Tax=Halobaculum gomorrense TaxID=43928 RepID=A0A1M5P8W8_9EURY|nr:bifunctional phosphopantothenoylcysteine decarboxylase/phosphopantothenate--cysteine ligase CoaBC [Halobaculum gomorrense]SHG98145.1 Phosphopantothenate-cysteine ligase /Phosphopantothenoylcysteine decarboxylase [Halobaculum gomorrense]